MSAGQSRRARGAGHERERAPRWPGDAETLTAAEIDFDALAHVLANSCRWGGRTRRFLSVAQHAVLASEEIEALDGLAAGERRVLALHALLQPARIAWLGDAEAAASQRATERARRLAGGIDRAVREAAGLDAEPSEAEAELLRFVFRMTDAAERRDLEDAGIPSAAGAAFPPARRRIRALGPGRAARVWLARLRELQGPPGEAEVRQQEAPHDDRQEEEVLDARAA